MELGVYKYNKDAAVGFPLRTDHLSIVTEQLIQTIALLAHDAIANLGDNEGLLLTGSLSKDTTGRDFQCTDCLIAMMGGIYYLPAQYITGNPNYGAYNGYALKPKEAGKYPLTWRDGQTLDTLIHYQLDVINYNPYTDPVPDGAIDMYYIKRVSDIYIKRQVIYWTTLTLNPSWEAYPTNPVQVYRNELKQLIIRGMFKLAESGLQTDPIATLPQGYRPSKAYYIDVFAQNPEFNNIEFPVKLKIGTDGVIGGISYYDTISAGYYTFNHIIQL